LDQRLLKLGRRRAALAFRWNKLGLDRGFAALNAWSSLDHLQAAFPQGALDFRRIGDARCGRGSMMRGRRRRGDVRRRLGKRWGYRGGGRLRGLGRPDRRFEGNWLDYR